MLKIEDYCDLIDENQPDFIEQLIKQGKIKNKNTKRPDELTDAEMDDYDLLRNEFKRGYTRNWRSTIDANCRYKSPTMVNLDTLQRLQASPKIPNDQVDHEQMFVFPCYAKPGKNYYMVRLE